jgi:hypothetical protein
VESVLDIEQVGGGAGSMVVAGVTRLKRTIERRRRRHREWSWIRRAVA